MTPQNFVTQLLEITEQTDQKDFIQQYRHLYEDTTFTDQVNVRIKQTIHTLSQYKVHGRAR